MSTRLRSRAASFLLAIIGTALGGTITAFIVLTVYFAAFQIAPARASSEPASRLCLQQSPDADRCRLR
jgi:hypothetical protein